jgi:hypothetical protein
MNLIDIHGTNNGMLINPENILKNLIKVAFQCGNISYYSKVMYLLCDHFSKLNFLTIKNNKMKVDNKFVSPSNVFVVRNTSLSKIQNDIDNLRTFDDVMKTTQKYLEDYLRLFHNKIDLECLMNMISSDSCLTNGFNNEITYAIL